ncbi:MAG TPA: hypothetical protein DEG43_04320 [Acidimicrobiaceae bacterium]|nr:hypothetical protein [Acidimicrobiaceae bacterium]
MCTLCLFGLIALLWAEQSTCRKFIYVLNQWWRRILAHGHQYLLPARIPIYVWWVGHSLDRSETPFLAEMDAMMRDSYGNAAPSRVIQVCLGPRFSGNYASIKPGAAQEILGIWPRMILLEFVAIDPVMCD